jgi:hypothetical protein
MGASPVRRTTRRGIDLIATLALVTGMLAVTGPASSAATGTVVAWGYDRFGQTDVPADLSNVTAVAAGDDDSLALRADGTVVAWGDDAAGQTTIPTGLSGVTARAGAWQAPALSSSSFLPLLFF